MCTSAVRSTAFPTFCEPPINFQPSHDHGKKCLVRNRYGFRAVGIVLRYSQRARSCADGICPSKQPFYYPHHGILCPGRLYYFAGTNERALSIAGTNGVLTATTTNTQGRLARAGRRSKAACAAVAMLPGAMSFLRAGLAGAHVARGAGWRAFGAHASASEGNARPLQARCERDPIHTRFRCCVRVESR